MSVTQVRVEAARAGAGSPGWLLGSGQGAGASSSGWPAAVGSTPPSSVQQISAQQQPHNSFLPFLCYLFFWMQLIDAIMTNPTVHLAPSYRDTGVLVCFWHELCQLHPFPLGIQYSIAR